MDPATIYLSGHKPFTSIPGESFVPIHVGRMGRPASLASIGDDTGDNISEMNPRFCEMTALYWIWRNTAGDGPVGLMHYRRHMNLSQHPAEVDPWGLVNSLRVDARYLSSMALTDEGVRRALDTSDIILPTKWDVRSAGHGSIREHYARSPHHHVEDFDLAMRVVVERHPEYSAAARAFETSAEGRFTNLFVLPRTVFDQFCSWVFPLLFEIDERIDRSEYSVQESRAIGYLSERLFSLFIEHCLDGNRQYRVHSAQRTFVLDTDPAPEPPRPAFADGVVAVMAFDDNFVPYAGAMLQSVVDSSSPLRRYDLHVLETGISSRNKKLLQSLLPSKSNFSLRFHDVSTLANWGEFTVHAHFSVETFYRLAIPYFFQNYSRVLYLDADVIVLRDIADLFDLEIGDAHVAGVHDLILGAFCKLGVRSHETAGALPARTYLTERLGLSDPGGYFQAGVMIFNIPAIGSDLLQRAQAFSRSNGPFWLVDQDVMNALFEGHVAYLDLRWNVVHGNGDLSLFDHLPVADREAYFVSREDPFIVHFAGERKPWNSPDVDFVETFWAASRKTPWYEVALLRAAQRPQPPSLPPPLLPSQVIRAFGNPFFPGGSRRRRFVTRLYRGLRALLVRLRIAVGS